MRLPVLPIQLAAIGIAGCISYIAATQAATWIEESTVFAVEKRLMIEGYEWASVDTDGLQVILSGEAQSEADRFSVLSTVSSIVDAARIIDDIQIKASQDLTAPEFSLEILRNDGGVFLIGLIPATTDRQILIQRVRDLVDDTTPISDFMETADYNVPNTWPSALSFGMSALETLKRSKISINQDSVTVTAISDDIADKIRMEDALRLRKPDNITADITISAPRPVITPFTLRFTHTTERTGFDACSADTAEAVQKIINAAIVVGLVDGGTCVEGLGVPSPRWGQAAAMSILSLKELGAGTVTMTDADISLIALQGTDKTKFDTVRAHLEANLPPLFVLTAILPDPIDTNIELRVPQFTAETQEDGKLQVRGDIANTLNHSAVESFAKAQFGAKQIVSALDEHPKLPQGWTLRIMAGLEGLAELHAGTLSINENDITVSGTTGRKDVGTAISQIMANRLGETVEFSLNIEYIESLDPFSSMISPEECIVQITALTNTQKINFEPGSANLDTDSQSTVKEIADILQNCVQAEIEIAGHTDSQGREVMNQALSRDRAQSVLTSLRMHRVPVAVITAVGYGESEPIADNRTAEGREKNRRIEFHLIEKPAEETSPENTTQVEATENE